MLLPICSMFVKFITALPGILVDYHFFLSLSLAVCFLKISSAANDFHKFSGDAGKTICNASQHA